MATLKGKGICLSKDSLTLVHPKRCGCVAEKKKSQSFSNLKQVLLMKS